MDIDLAAGEMGMCRGGGACLSGTFETVLKWMEGTVVGVLCSVVFLTWPNHVLHQQPVMESLCLSSAT